MKINNKIYLRTELIKGLIQNYRKLETELKEYLQPFGITLQQYNVLKILKGANVPLTTSVIRDRMIEKQADTSRLVERLCNKKLVDRYESKEDRRLIDVTISKEGIKFLEKMPDFDTVLSKIYNKLKGNEIHQLNILLDRLRG